MKEPQPFIVPRTGFLARIWHHLPPTPKTSYKLTRKKPLSITLPMDTDFTQPVTIHLAMKKRHVHVTIESFRTTTVTLAGGTQSLDKLQANADFGKINEPSEPLSDDECSTCHVQRVHHSQLGCGSWKD